MKKKLRKILIYIYLLFKIDLVFRFLKRRELFLIGYHSIAPDNASHNYLYPDLVISPEVFEEHLRLLISNGHTFISSKDIETTKARFPTMIYFDDAYYDVYQYAYPILKKYNISAVVFVPPCVIEEKTYIWSIKQRYLCKQKGKKTEEIQQEINTLRSMDFVEREQRLYKDIIPKLSIFLSWDNLSFLYKEGWEIGSHGMTHTRLNELRSNERLFEFVESKKDIESKIGNIVTLFSYPGGRVTSDSVSLCQSAQYIYAVSTESGTNKLPISNDNCFSLKKIAPKPLEDISMFKARLYIHHLFK